MKYLAVFLLFMCVTLAACVGPAGNGRGNRGAGGNGNGGLNPAEQTRTSTPTPQPTPDPIGAIQNLTIDLGTALSSGNADQLDSILSDGYLHINDQGQLVTKPDLIAGVRNGSVKFTSVNIQEVNIRVYGDAAVVTANFIGANAAGGSRSNVEDRVTFVAAREGDNWRFVSGQTTPMHPVPQNGNSKSGSFGASGTGSGGESGTGTGTGSSPP